MGTMTLRTSQEMISEVELEGSTPKMREDILLKLSGRPLKLFSTFGDLIQFLDDLQEPFLLVNSQGEVLTSSKHMRELLVEMGFQTSPDGKDLQTYFSPQENVRDFLKDFNRDKGKLNIHVKVPASEDLKELSWIVIKPEESDIFLLILSNDALLTIDSFRQNIINNLSHELRTPLTILKGMLDYLLNPVTSKMSRDKLNEYLRLMMEKTIDLEGLIHELLEVVRLEKGRFQIRRHWFPVKPLIERLAARYAGKAKKYKLRTYYEINIPDNAELFADPARMNYLISELLENSIKFSEEGGEITFKAETDEDNLILTFEDKGIGIPEMQLEKVFTPFFKGDNRPSRKTYGVGLGLFIVKRIVDGHGGDIEITSSLGKGTKVKVRLPNLRIRERSSITS